LKKSSNLQSGSILDDKREQTQNHANGSDPFNDGDVGMVFPPIGGHKRKRQEADGAHDGDNQFDSEGNGAVVRILPQTSYHHDHVDQIASEKGDGGSSVELRILNFVDSPDNPKTSSSNGRDDIRDCVEGAIIEIRIFERDTLVAQHEEGVDVQEDRRANEAKSENIAFWRIDGTVTDHRKPGGDVSLRDREEITRKDSHERGATSERGHK